LLKPMAFVVVRAGTVPTAELAEQLKAFARDHLAEYKRPRWVAFLEELPKTATGKLQRYKLREMGERLGRANISSSRAV